MSVPQSVTSRTEYSVRLLFYCREVFGCRFFIYLSILFERGIYDELRCINRTVTFLNPQTLDNQFCEVYNLYKYILRYKSKRRKQSELSETI